MEIRKARASDAREIIEVNVKTWCTTYSGIMPEEVLKKRVDSIEESIKKCEATVEQKDNSLVAIEDNKVVGIVSYGKSKVMDEINTGEIYSIYVLKEYQGRHIGEGLFVAANKVLKEKGYEKMALTCITQNASNKFYMKMGGKIIKVIKTNILGAELEENLILFDLKEIY
jgi:ribosomal protein S18 acetylase RimI-like enzyme